MAQYFPELGRLRELSKIALLVDFLRGLRKRDLGNMSRLKGILSNKAAWKEREAEIEKEVRAVQERYDRNRKKEYEEILKGNEGNFSRARESYSAYCAGIASELRENLGRIGSLLGGREEHYYSEVYTHST